MKKLLFSALGAAMLLVTSCQKDGLATAGDTANVSLSVAMGSASGTRATADYGTGTTVNRCILEVYASDGELYKRMVTATSGMTAQFDLRLVTSQEYQFVAWADYSENSADDYYYDTDSEDGLKAITADYTSYLGSDEKRDAFFGAQDVTVSAATVVDMTLTRPFGQLNIFTDLTDVINSKCPKGVRIMYSSSVAKTFNASTGDTSGSWTITWASTPVAVIEADQSEKDAKGVHLATDYILAPAIGERLINFNVAFFDDSDVKITNNDNFVNIPIKRNYRTNVSGELLTVDGVINVTLDENFLGDEDVTVADAPLEITITSSSDMGTLLSDLDASGIKSVVIEVGDDAKVEGLYSIPETTNIEEITFDFSDAFSSSGSNFYFRDGTGASDYSGKLNVSVPTDIQAGGILINAPKADVYVSGKAFNFTVYCVDLEIAAGSYFNNPSLNYTGTFTDNR